MIRLYDHSLSSRLMALSGVSVVAIDPGETTGMAWGLFTPEALLEFGVAPTLVQAQEAGLLHSLEVGQSEVQSDVQSEGRRPSPWPVDELELADRIVEQIDVWTDETLVRTKGRIPLVQVVVIEDFVLSLASQSRNLLSPVRLLPLICQRLHDREEVYDVVLQAPSNAMRVATDERLKRWGLYVAGSEHRKDAIRHMILWMRGLASGS